MEEIWKDVPGYEGFYKVSNTGKVLSTIKNIIMRPHKNNGYERVELHKNGKFFKFFVHRLVAQAFIPNPDNKPVVDHINTIRDDNNDKNWRMENMNLINAFIWAFLRRWYGGLFDDKFGGRGVQTAVMIFCTFVALLDKTIWWAALGLALWIQFQFWSRAVGEILDCGRSTTQNADSYDRWFRIPLDWVYDKLGKVKYTGMYDWWYGWLRYTLPMIVPAIVLFDWSFVLIGLMSSPIYYGSWWLFDKFPKLWQAPEWFGQPKNLAEIVYGFVFGLLIW